MFDLLLDKPGLAVAVIDGHLAYDVVPTLWSIDEVAVELRQLGWQVEL